MKKTLEQRSFPMQLRVAGDGQAPTLEGHVAVFNQLSDDLGGFREKILPGAFADTIQTQDIRALWNHDNDLVLGRLAAGTLELAEDEVGLTFKNTPPDTSWFRDRLVSLRRGDVTGCSFGFYTDADEWATEPDGTRVRALVKVTLLEVSPGVTFPAYPQTEVALRSLAAHLEKEKGFAPAGMPVVLMESRKRTLRLQRQVL